MAEIRVTSRATWPVKRIAAILAAACLVTSVAACSSSSKSTGSGSGPTGSSAPTGTSGGSGTSSGSAGGISAAECAANKAAGPITFVSPFGFDASAGIIDVFVADKLGYFAKMCIKTNFDTTATNGNELVSSNRAQVTGYGSAADAMNASSGTANIVSVATWANASDYAILTNSKITNLKQLEGKTMAYYTMLPVAVQATLTAAGVDVSKIKLVSTNNYDPTQVTRGVVDGLEGYQSNQAVSLKAAGAKFNLFTPSQFGVKGTYNVMSFNGDFLKAHRQTAADWMRADLYASNYCLTNQADCVNIEHTYAVAAHADTAFPLDHEMQVWSLEASLISNNRPAGAGLGVETYDQWTPEQQQLVQYKVVKTAPSLQKVEDVTLTAGLYNGTTLIWP